MSEPEIMPDEWKSGGEPMTERQRDYLESLCLATEQPFDPSLSKADAALRISELQQTPKVPPSLEQLGELKRLSKEAGLYPKPCLSKAAAAEQIDRLKKWLGRNAARSTGACGEDRHEDCP